MVKRSGRWCVVSETLRLFVALSPTPEQRKELAQITQSLGPTLGQWRLSPPENLHLTLAFLGSTPASALELLQKLLQENVTQVAAMVLVFDTLFTLPPHAPPRVLAIKPHKVPSELLHIYHEVEAVVQKLQQYHPLPQYRAEKKEFLPHLTLARSRGVAEFPKALDDALKKKPLSLTFTKLELFQSQLLPQGAQYKSLWKIELL